MISVSGPPPAPPGTAFYEPGAWVAHPAQADWGAGQVQSVVGARVTVNFEHAGKRTINTAVVALVLLPGPPPAER